MMTERNIMKKFGKIRIREEPKDDYAYDNAYQYTLCKYTPLAGKFKNIRIWEKLTDMDKITCEPVIKYCF